MFEGRKSIVPPMKSDSQNGFNLVLNGQSGNPNPPFYAFDDNQTTYFRSSIIPKLPESIEVTFPKPCFINGYSLLNAEYPMKRWKVYALKKDGKYVEIDSYENKELRTEKLFTPIECNGLKIECISAYLDNSWGVSEIKIYETCDKFLINTSDSLYSIRNGSFHKLIKDQITLEYFEKNGFSKEQFELTNENEWKKFKSENKNIEIIMLPVNQSATHSMVAKIESVNPLYKICENGKAKIYKKEV